MEVKTSRRRYFLSCQSGKNIKIIKVITPKYVRSDAKEEKIYQAVKEDIFPRSICTSSLASDVINAKYNLDVPLYRYAKYLNT